MSRGRRRRGPRGRRRAGRNYETKRQYELEIVATDDAIGDLDFDTYYPVTINRSSPPAPSTQARPL